MDPSYEATLSVLDGPIAGLVIPIHRRWGNVTIGSDPACSVPIPMPGLAAIEARLWIDDSGVTVFPTGRGFEVNGASVDGDRRLDDGDVFSVRDAQSGQVVAMEFRESAARVQACRRPGPVAVEPTAGSLALVRVEQPILVPEDAQLAVPLSPSFGVVGPFARFARTARALPRLAGSTVAWRLAHARLTARRQLRGVRARAASFSWTPASARPATPRLLRVVSPRVEVRISWTSRLMAALRSLARRLTGRRYEPAPALRVVGGTQHRPVPVARPAGATRVGRRAALAGLAVVVVLLSLLFFRPAFTTVRETLDVPAVAAGAVSLARPIGVQPAPAVRPAFEHTTKSSRRAVKRASLESGPAKVLAD